MTRRLGALAALLAALAAVPSTPWAQPAPAPAPEPDDPVQRALALYGEGRFAEAAVAFEQAYTKSPDPALLYAWAQALRQGGGCERAIEIYDRFLASEPNPTDRDAAIAGRAECIAKRPVPPPPEETARPTTPAVVAPAERPWYRDGVGAILIGAGAVGLATGGGLYLWARSSADGGETYGDAVNALDRARERRTIAVVVAGVGGALAVAGLVRLLTVDDEPERRGVALAPFEGGLGLGLDARW
jgi:tetratricopeptide (TPR) repeat protein